MKLVEALERSRVLAVLRSERADRFGEVAEVLFAQGVAAVEFTLTSEGVFQALESFAARAPEDLCLGAGTVLTVEDARRAVGAGARYLVSPNFVPAVVEEAASLGVPMVPGALTPTEIQAAFEAGAALVKVFPAGLGGPRYLKLVRDPLPAVPLLPTGGVTMEDAADYVRAGAVAVGMGSQLSGQACAGGDLGVLAERAARLVHELAVATSRP